VRAIGVLGVPANLKDWAGLDEPECGAGNWGQPLHQQLFMVFLLLSIVKNKKDRA
jgi:hypothetical protein